MTNKQINDLDQAGITLENIFHTLASSEGSAYQEFMEEMTSVRCFKYISNKIDESTLNEYIDDKIIPQLLIDFSLYGYVCEISIPKRSNFRFREDGTFESCSVHPGITSHEYVFGETINEMIEKCVLIGIDYRAEEEIKARLQLAQNTVTK